MKAFGICLSEGAVACSLGFRKGREYFCSTPTQCHNKRETPTLEVAEEHKPGTVITRNHEPAKAAPQKFWMVLRVDDLGKPAVRKHGSLDIARQEAIRLAKSCGGKYAILEAVEFVEAVAVKTAPQECTAKAQD